MSIWKLLLLFSIVASLTQAGPDGKCRGLVFSGGGDKGAYEAGVLKSFTTLLDPVEVTYDIIVGTSAGSINVAGMALFPMGQEKEATDFIVDQWKTMNQSQVYKNWPLGIAEGLFYEYGLFDTTPLNLLLTDMIKGSQGSQRDWSIATSNAMLARPKRWNQTVSKPQLITTVMASSAFPVFLPHIQIVDSGIFINVDIGGAILRCREMGYDDKDIYIDTLFTDTQSLPKVDATKFKTSDIAERAWSMFDYSLSERDYVYAREDYPHVNYRYTVMPSEELPSGLVPLLLDNEKINECLQIGEKDGANIVKAGEGVASDLVYERLKAKFSPEHNNPVYGLHEGRIEEVEVVSL